MLYIHIPYCKRKCIYCDFFSGGARLADWHGLRRALIAELAERSPELPRTLTSIYYGGGTPSLMPPGEFEALADGIRTLLLTSGITVADDCEITLEVNPEDADADHIMAWKRGGVNRVSVGIQTFSDQLLHAIGRSHSGDEARDALRLLCRNFSNVSGDLIFGLPGQTVETLADDVHTLISLHPQHVSVYSLMYEEGTALTVLRDAGRVAQEDESVVADQYRILTEILSDAGYEHYEISNYALPGYRSRHNSGYWDGKRYLGIGPSAHSYDGFRLRRANPADLFGYLRRFTTENDVGSKAPFYSEELLTDVELREERVMLGLRRREGIDLHRFRADFGDVALDALLRAARPYINAETLVHADGRLSLTGRGIMISDAIMVDLI